MLESEDGGEDDADGGGLETVDELAAREEVRQREREAALTDGGS